MKSEQARDDVSAVILAGGKSSRMGRPKALLLFGGEPLIVHIVGALNRLCHDILVVAAPGEQFVELSSLLRSQPDQPNELSEPNKPNKPNKPKVTLVRDEVAYQGPVAGIYYGLRAAKADVAFVTSCDVPFVNLPLITHLVSQISDYDVVVPYWQGRFQPLHAVYRRSVVPFLAEQLERSELRPVFLYKKVRTREVHEEEIRALDPGGLSFMNMNTREDYELALQRWQEIRERQESETVSSLSTSVPVSCTVELFSVARLVAKTAKVSLALPHEATLADVLLALAERLPMLVGPVIAPDRKSLTSGNSCNINGREFVRDPRIKVNSGDSIFIVSADAGG